MAYGSQMICELAGLKRKSCVLGKPAMSFACTSAGCRVDRTGHSQVKQKLSRQWLGQLALLLKTHAIWGSP